MLGRKIQMPTRESALAGREQAIAVSERHLVIDAPLSGPFPADYARILLGMGCFWGAERKMWEQPDVYSTAAGYAGGYTPNPTYEEVCSGQTGHTEVVQVVFLDRPEILERLLAVFWEAHDPTQGMRQGNDLGTQYRSAIYVDSESHFAVAERSLASYQSGLRSAGYGDISTEVKREQHFYYAEDYHQQYLAKNPNGYCGLAGTGVCALK